MVWHGQRRTPFAGHRSQWAWRRSRALHRVPQRLQEGVSGIACTKPTSLRSPALLLAQLPPSPRLPHTSSCRNLLYTVVNIATFHEGGHYKKEINSLMDVVAFGSSPGIDSDPGDATYKGVVFGLLKVNSTSSCSYWFRPINEYFIKIVVLLTPALFWMQWAPKDGIEMISKCIQDFSSLDDAYSDTPMMYTNLTKKTEEGVDHANPFFPFFHVDSQGNSSFSEKEAEVTSGYIAKISLDECVKKCIQVIFVFRFCFWSHMGFNFVFCCLICSVSTIFYPPSNSTTRIVASSTTTDILHLASLCTVWGFPAANKDWIFWPILLQRKHL